MNKYESKELADFLRFCRFERRLVPMTCAAYERNVRACMAYLQGRGIKLAHVKVMHLRAFLASEHNTRPPVSSQARTTAALQVFLSVPGRGRAAAARSCAAAADAEEAGCAAERLTMSELERLLGQPRRADIWERHFEGKPRRDLLLMVLMATAGFAAAS